MLEIGGRFVVTKRVKRRPFSDGVRSIGSAIAPSLMRLLGARSPPRGNRATARVGEEAAGNAS